MLLDWHCRGRRPPKSSVRLGVLLLGGVRAKIGVGVRGDPLKLWPRLRALVRTCPLSVDTGLVHQLT
jgi:hypothetical protein